MVAVDADASGIGDTSPVTASRGSTCPGPKGASLAISSARGHPRCIAGSTRSIVSAVARSAARPGSGGKGRGRAEKAAAKSAQPSVRG